MTSILAVDQYNWFRQSQKKQATLTSGLQLAAKVQSAPSKICGRQIDTSVNVNGQGGIPITPSSITPTMVQGNAFVAPTYIGPNNHGNLLLNPTAQQGLAAWSIAEAHPPGASTYGTDTLAAPAEFSISTPGGQVVDSLLVQQVNNLNVGATMTLSGLLTINVLGSSASMAGIDVLSPGAPDIGYGAGVLAALYLNATQPSTAFSLTFALPAGSTSATVRMHIRTNGTTDAITAHYGQLKLENGSSPTPFNLASFNADTQIDIAGVVHSINTSIGFTNIPLNAVGVLWLFRNTTSKVWVPWAETSLPGVPYPPASQTLSFAYGQLTLGINYDFGAAYVDMQGNVGAISAFAVAYNPNSSIFKINSSYMTKFSGSYVPQASSASVQVQASPNGIAAAVQLSVSIVNQPQDGSLSRVSFFYRVTGSSTWSFYGSLPAVGVGNALASLPAIGAYTFTYADLTAGTISYDFGIAAEDASGGETTIVQVQTASPGSLSIGSSALAAAPKNTFVDVENAKLIGYSNDGNATWYGQLSFTLKTLSNLNGPEIDHTAWLAQINILAKPIFSATISDADTNTNDYIIVKSIYANTYGNPISVLIGPFPAKVNQEIAIELIDQAGNSSPSLPFELGAAPNGPTFNADGSVSYQSLGTAITGVITANGKLQPNVVTRGTVPINDNLIFNPTGAAKPATNNPFPGWTQLDVSSPCTVVEDGYAGGRFFFSFGGGSNLDTVVYQSFTQANNTPLISNAQMVLSGLIEVHQSSDPATLIGVDILEIKADGTGGATIASYFVSGTQAMTAFPDLVFTTPSSGQIQVRMHVYNNHGTGSLQAYFYRLKLEYTYTGASTLYNDARSSGAVDSTHSPANQMIVTTVNVDTGQIQYQVQPSSTQNVINNTTGTYDASQATPPSGTAVPVSSVQAPYYATPGAVQLGVGSGGEIKNGQFINKAFSLTYSSSGSSQTAAVFVSVPTGGSWQVVVTTTVNGATDSGSSIVFQTLPFLLSGAPPTNQVNTFSASGASTTNIWSYQIPGGGGIYVGANIKFTYTGGGSKTLTGTYSAQLYRILGS